MIRHTLPRSAYNKWTEIDLNALRDNVHSIRQTCRRDTEIMAVIKANAYGHNVSLVAPALLEEGITRFGVATIAEGAYLKTIIPSHCEILILGALSRLQYEQAIASQLSFMIHSVTHIPLINRLAYGVGCQAHVHLKVDTGMGRVGIRPEDFGEALRLLGESTQIQLQGICSHLATSDRRDCPYIKEQLVLFDSLHRYYHNQEHARKNMCFHLANSDGIFQYPQSHYTMVRPGISLYGYGSHTTPLKPVLSLKGQMTQIHNIPANQGIGYGRTYVTSQESTIAVLPIGYADGLNRLLSNRMQVLIHGQKVPIVGRISMDQCLIDVTSIAEDQAVSLESPVTLLGTDGNQHISAQDWANCCDTITYEILTSLGPRIPRYSKSEESERT